MSTDGRHFKMYSSVVALITPQEIRQLKKRMARWSRGMGLIDEQRVHLEFNEADDSLNLSQ